MIRKGLSSFKLRYGIPNILNCRLTPKTHENSEKHCSWIIKKVSDPGLDTCCVQIPVVADIVALRTHLDSRVVTAHLLTAHRTITLECNLNK